MNIEKAAQKLADCMDYPWEFMPEQGRENMRNHVKAIFEAADDAPPEDVRAVVEPQAFQARVQPWMLACFGADIAADQQERNHRFLEEALELVQACGATGSEAHQLVDYVYGREIGEKSQEVGGVMVTLAALCLAQGMDMHNAAETELARIWTKVEQIRAKQLAKPAMGPLPGAYPDRAVVVEPVYQILYAAGWEDVDYKEYWTAQASADGPDSRVLYRHPQRPVVLPKFNDWYAKNVGVLGTAQAKNEESVWRACLDAVEELNK